jgi:hypothetical protein
MKPVQVQILRSGYVLDRTKLRTVVELEAALIRRKIRDARVLPARDVSYRKVAAALKVFQRQGVSLGFIGNARDGVSESSTVPNNTLVPTRKSEALLLAAQRGR